MENNNISKQDLIKFEQDVAEYNNIAKTFDSMSKQDIIHCLFMLDIYKNAYKRLHVVCKENKELYIKELNRKNKIIEDVKTESLFSLQKVKIENIILKDKCFYLMIIALIQTLIIVYEILF